MINLAIISVILVLVLIGALYWYRRRGIKFFICHRKSRAIIISIEEIKKNEMMLYNSLNYFYPKIRVFYEVGGQDFDVTIFVKNMEVSELDQFGTVRDDQYFPWRALEVGDSITIWYMGMFPEISYIKKLEKPESGLLN